MLFLFPLGSGYKWRIFQKPHLPFLTVSVSIITFHFLASLQLGQKPVTNVRLWTGMSFLVLNFQEHGCQLPVPYFCSGFRPYSTRWIKIFISVLTHTRNWDCAWQASENHNLALFNELVKWRITVQRVGQIQGSLCAHPTSISNMLF